MNERENFIKGYHLVEVVGHDGKRVLWEVVDYNAIEEATDYDEIGLWGFNFNVFDREEKGVG